MNWNPGALTSKLTNNRYSNFGSSDGDKTAQGVVSYSVGFVHPALSFNSYGLNSQNAANIQSQLKISNVKAFDLSGIKTKLLRDNRSSRAALASMNPTEFGGFIDQLSMYPMNDNGTSDKDGVENVFTPSVNVLMNMNNYRFQYDNPITNLISYTQNEEGKDKPLGKITTNIKVSPSLFNPLYMIQVVGMTSNVPLLNNKKGFNIYDSNKNGESVVSGSSDYEDVSDCTIKELVSLSYKPNSILGLARYRYSDFMYCKDLGKVANNHLITLRRFARPISDNIFELTNPEYGSGDYSFSQSGDIGRLVTWFDTEDNKLEDILKFSYKATWKELKAKIDEIESKEDDPSRGPLGMLINSASGAYNSGILSGYAGGHHIFSSLGATPPNSDARDMMRNYDNNKVYTPKDTIQDTHTYEGRLEFTHEFTLTFSYKLRAYDNINPKSAFLDLLGNILAVTYRRGKFWGGDRKMIGPSQNIAAWKKANAFIDNAWDKLGGVMSGLMNGTFNLGNILGAMSGLASSVVDGLKSVYEGGLNGLAESIANIVKQTKLDQAALGTLKNKLGRPALYALDSLLKGDDVGLWHVTIGNPKNPIVAIGNLILTDASIQQFGPLGLDDFPTELKVTCTLKHARGRDAVEIGRMYTKGTNGIYYPHQNKNINNWYTFANNSFSNTKIEQQNENKESAENKSHSNEKDNERITQLDAFNKYSKNIKGNDGILINNPYAAQIDQHNQILGYDLVLILDELA